MNTEQSRLLANETLPDPQPRAARSPLRGLRRFVRDSWLNSLGLALVALLVVLAIGGAALAPYSPTKTSLGERFRPPSALHLMGTDNFGRDIFSRVLSGARISLQVAVIVLSISVVIGFLIGAAAGLAGGFVDEA